MTGIERLRHVAHGWGSKVISDIADQIERETEERSARLYDMRLGEETDVCELFGVEPVDDPLTSLRRHVENLNDTIENLRLELGEARDAIAWVRDHGGIAYVKDAWNVRSNLDRQLEKAQAKVERQQRHIESLQGKLSERRVKINVMRAQMAEMRPRLMPEGMEWLVEAWPRFEDDAPVRFLDDFERYGEENGVSAVTMYADGSFALNCRAYSKGERVKRPSVIAADGEPLEVGQTVYGVENGAEYKVCDFDEGGPIVEYWDGGICVHGCASPTQLTHRAPVLAADGRLLREGETVWHRSGNAHGVVESIDAGSLMHTVRYRSDDGEEYRDAAKDLTHERPDSWERLEEDAKAEPGEYCVTHELSAAYMGGEAEEYAKAEDLVRRARALAERGA